MTHCSRGRHCWRLGAIEGLRFKLLSLLFVGAVGALRGAARHRAAWRNHARHGRRRAVVASPPARPNQRPDATATRRPKAGPLARALRDVRPTPATPSRPARSRSRWRVAASLLLLLLLIPLAYGWHVTTTLRETERRIVVPLPAEVPPPPVAAAAPAPAPTALPTPTPASQVSLVGAMIGAATADGDPGADPIWRGRRYLNVLVLGFDSRPGQQGPPRSDVFMIAQLDLVAKSLNVISIPRDLWLSIPGFGDERINAAYPLGWRATQPAAGVALAKQTVEQNFGVPIDYYVSVDFSGFKRTVDAVGGVTIDVPRYLRDDAYPTEDYGVETIEFFPGPQRMDGTRALKYARTRHADSDYGRRLRQEQLVLALLSAGQDAGIVARLPAVLRSFAGTVQTNFSFEEQLVLGRVALAMKQSDVTLYSIDETMTRGWLTPGGADVILGDWALIEQLVARAFATPARSERIQP